MKAGKERGPTSFVGIKRAAAPPSRLNSGQLLNMLHPTGGAPSIGANGDASKVDISKIIAQPLLGKAKAKASRLK